MAFFTMDPKRRSQRLRQAGLAGVIGGITGVAGSFLSPWLQAQGLGADRSNALEAIAVGFISVYGYLLIRRRFDRKG